MADAATTITFERDTTVSPLAEAGAFAATVAAGWSAPPGPNGGYIAAIVLRAMQAMVPDDRPPRSLTLHYLRPPAVGDVRVDVTVEREGRTLSSLTARMTQDGRDILIALGAFAGTFPSALDYASEAPQVPPAADIEPIAVHPAQPPIAHRFEIRPAVGGLAFTGGPEALTGGWIRLREPRPLDGPLLAMYSDAWMPASFTRLTEIAPAPTIDLTIHFRNPEAAARVGADESVLAVFSSRTSADGFWEEDGELWSADGTLLAQSRQLALLIPMRKEDAA